LRGKQSEKIEKKSILRRKRDKVPFLKTPKMKERATADSSAKGRRRHLERMLAGRGIFIARRKIASSHEREKPTIKRGGEGVVSSRRSNNSITDERTATPTFLRRRSAKDRGALEEKRGKA